MSTAELQNPSPSAADERRLLLAGRYPVRSRRGAGVQAGQRGASSRGAC